MKKMILLVMLVVASMTMATAAYAIGPAYIPWNAGGGNAGTNGPHQNYQLNTEKCAVCHSVHAAATSNAAAGVFGPVAAGPTGAAETQLLLRNLHVASLRNRPRLRQLPNLPLDSTVEHHSVDGLGALLPLVRAEEMRGE